MASPKNKRKEPEKLRKKASLRRNKLSAITRELGRNPNNTTTRAALAKWQAQ